MKPKGAVHIKRKVIALPKTMQHELKDFIGTQKFIYIYDNDLEFSAHIKKEIKHYEDVGFDLITIKYGNKNISVFKKGQN